MDVDSQPTMEETILVGDDLMLGPPSPLIPPDIASHVLEGVDLCDNILKNLYLCLQINDIEPFCQDEIVLYKQCAEKRDKELRKRLQESEYKLGMSMPMEEAKERAGQLQASLTNLDRRMILASGMGGMEGFRQRWSLHGRIEDTKKRLEALNQGIENNKSRVAQKVSEEEPNKKKWFFCTPTNKKNVLIVNTNSGGHAVIGFYFAKDLLSSGHDVTVLTVGDESSDKMKKPPFTRFHELVTAGGSTVWGSPNDVGNVVGGKKFDVVLDNNGKDLDTVKPVADWAKSSGAEQFLYISSAGIYKPTDEVPHVEGEFLKYEVVQSDMKSTRTN